MAAVGNFVGGGLSSAFVAAAPRAEGPLSSPENAIQPHLSGSAHNDEEAMLDVLGADGKQIVSWVDETKGTPRTS